MYKNILYEVSEGICVITLNRPKVLNALDATMYEELYRAAECADFEKTVRVVVICGAGKSFCAGDDITDGDLLKERTFLETYHYIIGLQNVFNRLEAIQKPVLAALHGATCGGGLELALACDLRVASEDLKLGLPELKLGAIPCVGGTQRLPRLIGAARTKELLFLGDLITAKEAERWGIVNRVVAPGTELERTLELAARIKEKGALSLSMAKRAVDRGLDLTLAAGLDAEAHSDAMLFDTEDFREGMVAFAEKRAPNFRGR